MLKTETRVIDGFEVSCTQLPVLEQMSLLARLGKVFGPALAKMSGGIDLQADVSTLAPVISTVFAELDPSTARSLILSLVRPCAVKRNGELVPLMGDQIVDGMFAGKLKTLLSVALFSAGVNFADFFGGAVGGTATDNPPAGESDSN